jgi:AcrR family transcriptional regulator
MGKGERTKSEIIDRALAMAGEVGLEGLSLGVLAAGLNLSKSGLFAHFKSKEGLQLDVLQRAIDHFVQQVVLPALTKARGEPRVRALFHNYVAWIHGRQDEGGCLFMALNHEYDDRPGSVRELLVESQRDWIHTLARAARISVEEKHFRADLDADQFAFEVMGIAMELQQAVKLFADARALTRAKDAFDGLLQRSRRGRH